MSPVSAATKCVTTRWYPLHITVWLNTVCIPLQVGACIVNADRKIVGIGYNGMPIGCSDDELPWAKEADSCLDTKYPYGESSVYLWMQY